MRTGYASVTKRASPPARRWRRPSSAPTRRRLATGGGRSGLELLPLGLVDEPAPGDSDADEDADHECEEDRREGRDVVRKSSTKGTVLQTVRHASSAVPRLRLDVGADEAPAQKRRSASTSKRFRSAGDARTATRSAASAASDRRTNGQTPTLRAHEAETPFASTRISPTLRRVTKVDDIPSRSRSRNSTRLKWVPTATMS